MKEDPKRSLFLSHYLLYPVLFCPSDACELTPDTNTAHRNLRLSDSGRKVTGVRDEEPYPHHSERFKCCQLLCRKEGFMWQSLTEEPKREETVLTAALEEMISLEFVML